MQDESTWNQIIQDLFLQCHMLYKCLIVNKKTLKKLKIINIENLNKAKG